MELVDYIMEKYGIARADGTEMPGQKAGSRTVLQNQSWEKKRQHPNYVSKAEEPTAASTPRRT